MIIHVLNRAKESKVGEVLVATPDEEIFQIVKENGGKAFLTKENHIQVVTEFMKHIKEI